MKKVLSGIFLGLLCGFALGRYLPTTTLEHPVLTYQAYKIHPIGSKVYPINTKEAQEQFQNFGWYTEEFSKSPARDREPAIIVDYEFISFEGNGFLIYRIRTMNGRGYVLGINQSWIKNSKNS